MYIHDGWRYLDVRGEVEKWHGFEKKTMFGDRPRLSEQPSSRPDRPGGRVLLIVLATVC